MKNIIFGAMAVALLITSCQKKTSPVDGSNATIELANLGAKYVTGDITLNPKDSIYLSFSVTSPRDMRYVSVQKNPVNQTAFLVRDTLTAANKNSYSTVKKFMADSANGSSIYRIVAHDAIGNYIGNKDIKVTITPDFMYYTYRFLYVPDTTAKTNTSFMSATTGEMFSYTTGAANSAKIDFGIMFDTTGAKTPSTTDDLKFSLYSLSAAQGQIPFYDLGTWTKNATIMKKGTAPTFASILSAGSLRSAAVTNLASGTTNKVTQLVANNLVFFKTSTGKTGCLQVNFVNDAGTFKESYINVDVKIEK